MIAGLLSPDDGEIIGARSLTFGYLPQDGLFVHGSTLMEEALSVFGSLRVLEGEIKQLEHRLAEMKHSGSEYERILERYSQISQEFRLKDGYFEFLNLPSDTHQVWASILEYEDEFKRINLNEKEEKRVDFFCRKKESIEPPWG